MTARSSSISRKHRGTLYFLSATLSRIDSAKSRPSPLWYLPLFFIYRWCLRRASIWTSRTASYVDSFAVISSSVIFALLKSTGYSSCLCPTALSWLSINYYWSVPVLSSLEFDLAAAASSFCSLVSSSTRISKCRWLSLVLAVWVGSCARHGIRYEAPSAST